jgi:sialidase-1
MSPATLTKIPGTSTLVCIWNDHREKPLAFATEQPPRRTPLSIAVSRDNGRTWGTSKVIEEDPESGYCYVAAEWVGDRLLLGYCAARSRWGLNSTQLIAIDRKWIDQ